MKILADTNILISALLYPASKPGRALMHVADHYNIVAPLSPQKLIADPKDAPILNAAILAEVDIILSGDKHFLVLDIERPKVMTAAEYLVWADVELD